MSEKTPEPVINGDPDTLNNAVTAPSYDLDLSPGEKISRYVIVEVLGRGGMGTVYKAYDTHLNRGVALKLLQSQQADGSQGSSGSTRLLREAQALARLAHPNVVSVHDVGVVGSTIFVAMELVEGQTLREWRNAARRSTKEILEVMLDSGRGLSAAHQAKLIHRDFKPANVVVGDDGRVRVIDFGLARPTTIEPSGEMANELPDGAEDLELATTRQLTEDARDSEDASPDSYDLLASPLTLAGALMGTPLYMAPEQVSNQPLDARADQFSFCVVLFEILYGRRPFTGRSVKDFVNNVLQRKMQPRPANADVPAWLHNIILRGLSPDPNHRYPSMEALLEELSHDPDEVANRRRAKRRRLFFGAGLLLLATAVPAGIWYELVVRRSEVCAGAPNYVAEIWNDSIQKTMHEAFLATGSADAQKTWTQVEGHISTYTGDWAALHTRACEATRVKGEQSEAILDLRMFCLDERLRQVRALVSVLSEPDEASLPRAIRAAQNLPTLDRCNNIALLKKSAASLEPIVDSEKVKHVEELRKENATNSAMVRMGRYKEALANAEDTQERAQQLQYRPIAAEAMYHLADIQEFNGLIDRVLDNGLKALYLADASGHDRYRAKTANLLFYTLSIHERRHERADLIRSQARAALDRLGEDLEEEAEWHNNNGLVANSRRKYDQALEHFEAATRIGKRLYPPNHPRMDINFNNLGLVYNALGNYDKAIEFYKRSLEIKINNVGEDSHLLVRPYNNIGLTLETKGDLDAALDYYQRGLATRERDLGPDHPHTALNLINIARVFLKTERWREANDRYQRALEIREKQFGLTHLQLLECLHGLSVCHEGLGDTAQADVHIQRLLSICEELDCESEDTPDIRHFKAYALFRTASAAWRAKQGSEAQKLVRDALRVLGNPQKQAETDLAEEIQRWMQERGWQVPGP